MNTNKAQKTIKIQAKFLRLIKAAHIAHETSLRMSFDFCSYLAGLDIMTMTRLREFAPNLRPLFLEVQSEDQSLTFAIERPAENTVRLYRQSFSK